LPADRTYYINFGAKGYGSSQEKVPTEDGNVIELPPVVLKKADLNLLGQVVDSAGTPLAKASIINLPSDAAAPGKAILLCLFDCEQRPSRQAIRLLTEQTESLRQKGVAVLGIQAAVVSSDSFDPWKQANPLPFKIGRITAKTAASAWAADTESLASG
jgi:hypothetical protein